MPMTPKGTLTRLMCSPLGSVRSWLVRPSGDGSRATLRMSAAMASSLSAVSRSLS